MMGVPALEVPVRQRLVELAEAKDSVVDVAAQQDSLGQALFRGGRFRDAAELYTRALAIKEKALGAEHAHVADTLCGMANVRESQGQTEEAMELYTRVLAIQEKALGAEHADVANTLHGMANVR